MAAVSITDSTATFKRQALRLGLPEDLVSALIDNGVSTLGGIAFAVVPPGTGATDDQIKEFAQSIAPLIELSIGEVAAVKRFIFEAQTALIGQLRAEADPCADPASRKLPPPERAARCEEQKRRLAGLDLTGPLEVAHSVYDLFAGMLEQGQLKYVHPCKCITRAQEVGAIKPPKEIRLDTSSNALVVKEATQDKDCSTATDMEVWQALTRRSLAMDCIGIMDFQISQKWIQSLFSILQQPSAPGFNKTTLTQLLRTDRQAYMRMAELSPDGVKPTAAGIRPLDDLMQKMRDDATVMFYMLPTLMTARAHYPEKENKKRKADAAPDSSTPQPAQQWSKKGKGKKGKGKGAWNSGKLPERLKGCTAVNAENERICFAYNLDGCDQAAPGGTCSRGRHQCCKKGCFQNHPQHAHQTH